MMKKQNEAHVSDILKEMVGQPKYASKLTKIKLQNAWIKIMGETINRYTSKIYIRGSILTIEVTSSALRQDLFMSRDKILVKINRHIGHDQITEIKVR